MTGSSSSIFCRDLLVQGEELGYRIPFGAEAIGGKDSGVERGVGIVQQIRARLRNHVLMVQAVHD